MFNADRYTERKGPMAIFGADPSIACYPFVQVSDSPVTWIVVIHDPEANEDRCKPERFLFASFSDTQGLLSHRASSRCALHCLQWASVASGPPRLHECTEVRACQNDESDWEIQIVTTEGQVHAIAPANPELGVDADEILWRRRP